MSSPSGPGLPPATVPSFGVHRLPRGTILHRVFTMARGRTATTFNPGLGSATRFAPLQAAGPGGPYPIPTLYAGLSFEAAVFETVFRDIAPEPLPRRVREATFAGYAHAELTVQRDLELGPLFNQNLKLLGQTRLSMIECHGAAAYRETARWAEVIHRCHAGLQGLTWMSRQQDSELAVLLFGDRVGASDLAGGTVTPLGTGAGRRRVSDMAVRFRVDIIP